MCWDFVSTLKKDTAQCENTKTLITVPAVWVFTSLTAVNSNIFIFQYLTNLCRATKSKVWLATPCKWLRDRSSNQRVLQGIANLDWVLCQIFSWTCSDLVFNPNFCLCMEISVYFLTNIFLPQIRSSFQSNFLLLDEKYWEQQQQLGSARSLNELSLEAIYQKGDSHWRAPAILQY